MASIQGSLLVASPHLPDPNFYRSVVLMVEHNEEGAMGLVLNRVSDTSLRTVWESVENADCNSEQYLFVGGPVDGPLMALHADPSLEGFPVIPGINFTTDRDSLKTLATRPTHDYRIFSGYAGWGPGQLDAELEVGGWLVSPGDAEDVLGDEDELWKRITHAIGDRITRQAIRSRHVPADPQAN